MEVNHFFIIVCKRDIKSGIQLSEEYIYPEKELLLRAAQGDESAFDVIYEQNWRKVYSYIEPLVKSSETTEEIVADIFVNLWQSKERLKDIESLGAFLRTVARNKALDFIKVTARQKAREYLFRAEIVLRSPVTPHEKLLSKEMIKIFRNAVEQLSPQRRKIFLMHREEGLSYNEIAEKLQISPTTAKKTVFDALDSIKRFLRNHYNQLEILVLFLFYEYLIKGML